MLTTILGAALVFFAANEVAVVETHPQGTVLYDHPVPSGVVHERGVVVQPVSEFRYRNVVRQAYDYSCGSAALTTVLNGYLGRQYNEREVMEGLLRFGETEKIVERRGFSLLDMRRLTSVLGFNSGGFRAQLEDLRTLEHPAIVPISYAGFKHFVVLKEWRNGHFYVADPALGNMSFSEVAFEEIWDQNVVFIVFPHEGESHQGLSLSDYELRTIDERTINRMAFQDFPVFTRSMEQWADRASTLVPVLTEDRHGVERVINIPTRTYYRRK